MVAPGPGGAVSSQTDNSLLQIRNLNVAYGDVQVLWEVDLDVFKGEIVALVGSNGAGKSTLLATISGLVPPRPGSSILFQGQELAGATSRAIFEAGIVHVPEGRHLFGAMTVRENLLLGAFRRRNKAEVEADLQHVLELFPRIRQRLNQLAAKLSGGEQQMVAIGRGLMARPKLLMIDELSLGLAPVVIDGLLEILQQVNQSGTTILIVEQDVQTALELAGRGYVLETGYITLTDSAKLLLQDERVKKAYLGI